MHPTNRQIRILPLVTSAELYMRILPVALNKICHNGVTDDGTVLERQLATWPWTGRNS